VQAKSQKRNLMIGKGKKQCPSYRERKESARRKGEAWNIEQGVIGGGQGAQYPVHFTVVTRTGQGPGLRGDRGTWKGRDS